MNRVTMKQRIPTKKELTIYMLLNDMRKYSTCLDKQVVCVLTTQRYDVISIGVNSIIKCDQNCHDKVSRVCHTSHAEIEASNRISPSFSPVKKLAFLNLYPCVPCQNRLLNEGVTSCLVFGTQHKGVTYLPVELLYDPIYCGIYSKKIGGEESAFIDPLLGIGSCDLLARIAYKNTRDIASVIVAQEKEENTYKRLKADTIDYLLFLCSELTNEIIPGQA